MRNLNQNRRGTPSNGWRASIVAVGNVRDSTRAATNLPKAQSAMRRMPFLLSTICGASLAALFWAAYSGYANSSRRHAADVFDRSIDNEINSKYSTGVDELVAAYGPAGAARHIEAKAKTADTIAFDGTSRLVKIVEHTKEWTGPDPARTGHSDGIVLKAFGHDASAVWDGPMGTRISSVRFLNGELVVSVYGHLRLGTLVRVIPPEEPEDYIVPWAEGSAPTAGSLYDSVVARHQGDG